MDGGIGIFGGIRSKYCDGRQTKRVKACDLSALAEQEMGMNVCMYV